MECRSGRSPPLRVADVLTPTNDSSSAHHFARPTLVEQMLTAFDSGGLVNRLTLFAPRGHGKTAFLRCDLAPAAEKAGYNILYVNLSSNPNAPQQVLLRALREATAGGGVKSWRHLAGDRLHEAQIQGSIEADPEMAVAMGPRRCTSEELQQINYLLNHLCRGKGAGRTLLLLDDFDRFADAAFEPIIYSLRTLLDRLRDNIKVVFTGSSRHALSSMFNDSSAPFFLSSTSIDLPPLGRDFVEYECDAFENQRKRALDRRAAWVAFQDVHRCPERFIHMLIAMGDNPDLNFETARGETP